MTASFDHLWFRAVVSQDVTPVGHRYAAGTLAMADLHAQETLFEGTQRGRGPRNVMYHAAIGISPDVAYHRTLRITGRSVATRSQGPEPDTSGQEPVLHSTV